jgi:hypothetical protein
MIKSQACSFILSQLSSIQVLFFYTNAFIMSSSNLVALAAAVRKTLSSPVVIAAKDEAGKRARKELIDTLPDLQRALETPERSLMKELWSVSNLNIPSSSLLSGGGIS